MANHQARQDTHTQLTQEVLELGEELFELALGQPCPVANHEAGDGVLELREAKEEFFTALQLLLGGATEGAMS